MKQVTQEFLVPVAARLREYDEGEDGVRLVAVLPNRYERMAVAMQTVLLGALAVVQEWERDDNPGGEVAFTNISALKAGLREFRLLPAWRGQPEAPRPREDEGRSPSSPKPGWGRGSGCEKA